MAARSHLHHLLVFLVVWFSPSFNSANGAAGFSRFAKSNKYNNNNNNNHQERDYHMKKIEAFKASLTLMGHQRDSLISPSPPFTSATPPVGSTARVYHVTSYGADPTGKSDSTDAILKAFSDASSPPNEDDTLIAGIANAGGSQILLDGGIYLVGRPLRFPITGVGNIVIQGGTLKASDDFPKDGYIIDLSPTPTVATTTSSSNDDDQSATQNQQQESFISNTNSTTTLPNPSDSTTIGNNNNKASSSTFVYEYITLRDILFDCNYNANGVNVVNSLRTGIDNLFIAHFSSFGIHVQSGHETIIRDSYLGQHITAGGDPGERNFSGTAIALAGNDNVLSNVIIFSADTGVLVSGQANLLTGVHCYNKATGFGGTGIYLRLPGLTQTRIVDSYMDYTGIVAEDPVQLVVSNCFFLGDAGVTLRAVNGVADGVVIVDNIFSGNGNGKEIVRLDGGKKFTQVGQVMVERNSVRGMNVKTTTARVTVDGNASRWEADFTGLLLFPDLIKHVQYSVLLGNNNSIGDNGGVAFPKVSYALTSVKDNRVVIQSDVQVPATFYVMVDQGS